MKHVETVVTLRVVRGTKITYNEDGSLANDNQTVTVRYNTIEWSNFLKNLHINGFGRVTVESAHGKPEGGDWEEIKDLAHISKEVETAMTPKQVKSEKDLEVERMAKELAELKAMLKPVDEVEEVEEAEEIDEELEAARDEYEQLFGKRPHHLAQTESIKKKIEEKKQEN